MTKAVSALRRRARQRRTEAGSTLVMVLVIVIVIGISCSAVLQQQTTTLAAQQQLTAKANVDTTADNALAATEQLLRGTGQFGRPNDSTYGVCSKTTEGEAGVVYESDDGSVQVKCWADPASGLAPGWTPDVPPNTILTLGGRGGAAPTASVPPNSGNTGGNTKLSTSAADEMIPWCHDYHETTNSDGCEAGVYVGPGAGQTSDGALIVQASGPGNADLVKTNSSIDVRDGDRYMKVQGNVVARWACDSGSGPANAGGYLQLQTGWDPESYPHGENGPSTRRCDQGGLMTPEPDYTHALSNYQAQGATIPGRVDTDSTKNFNLTPAIPACSTGVMTFEPGYYNTQSTTSLNSLFGSCTGLYWFKPGVYYFNGGPLSVPPRGDVNSAMSFVVGGTPNGWNPGTNGFGSQVDKTLYASKVLSHPQWGTDVVANEATGPPNGRYSEKIIPAPASYNDSASIKLGDFGTLVPDAYQWIDKFVLDVTHREASPAANYATDYPRIEISMADRDTCVLALPKRATLTTDSIDLTHGCPTTGLPPGWKFISKATRFVPPIGVNGGLWIGRDVNTLKVDYQLTRSGPVETSAGLDAVRARVDYNGRAAPNFSGSCDPSAQGVQMIFGGDSRLAWTSQDVYFELCGSRRTKDPFGANVNDPYGFAIYGLSEKSSSVPSFVTSADYPFPTSFSYSGQTVSDFAPIDESSETAVPMSGDAVTTARIYGKIGDNQYGRVSWATSGTRSQSFELPLDVVPANATVLRVKLKARYKLTTTDTDPATPPGINKVQLTLEPGFLRSGSPSPTQWSSSVPSQVPDGAPLSSNEPPTYPQNRSMRPPLAPATAGDWITYEWGNYDDPATAQFDLNDDWRYERSLSEAVRNSTGINGARFRFDVEGGSSDYKEALFDGVEFEVTYRPNQADLPDRKPALEPVRGCTTMRQAENPAASASVDPVTGYPIGADWDWAARLSGSVWKSDAAYTAGNSGQSPDDIGACALLRIDGGVKFHLEGSIFAPTGAVDLRGNDNDASFVTGGVVARHLTAYRWINNGDIPAFGGSPVRYSDRNVYLVAVRVADGKELAREKVHYTDAVTDQPNKFGQKVDVPAYLRREGS